MAETQMKIRDVAPYLAVMLVSAAAFLLPTQVNQAQKQQEKMTQHTGTAKFSKNEMPDRRQGEEEKKPQPGPKSEAVMFDHQQRTGEAVRLMARGKNGKPIQANFSPETRLTQRKILS